MAKAALSVIIDVYEMEMDIPAFLRTVSSMMKESKEEIEYLIIDKGSGDHTVWEALKALKELGLDGKVLQNGEVPGGCALNTGIYRASGRYLVFIRPSEFYRAPFAKWLEEAQECGAEIFYGLPAEQAKEMESNLTEKQPVPQDGCQVMTDTLSKGGELPLGCVLFHKDFLMKNRLTFSEDYSCGYQEAFLYQCLLHVCERIYFGGYDCRREPLYKNLGDSRIKEFACFEKVDALVEIRDMMKNCGAGNKKMVELMEHQRLPSAVLECVETLLKSGRGYNAVSRYVQKHGYYQLLKSGHSTGRSLRKKIFVWKKLPWMYQPSGTKKGETK